MIYKFNIFLLRTMFRMRFKKTKEKAAPSYLARNRDMTVVHCNAVSRVDAREQDGVNRIH